MKFVCINLFAAGLLSVVPVRANDIDPGKEHYTAIRAHIPIVLDGDLSEWSEWRGADLLTEPRFSIPKGSGEGGAPHANEDGGEMVFFEELNEGSWTGPADHASSVQVVYDNSNVYIGLAVTDDHHENSANSPWNGDSVQLMIANADRNEIMALYNYALGGVENDPGEVIVQHERSPASPGDATEAAIVRDSGTRRTIYEIKLSKEALGLETLQGGVRFGLGMAINDGDEDDPGQTGWGGLGAHSVVYGKSPEETALVTLATSNDIEPGKEYYTANPAPKDVILDGDLEEWRGVPVLSDPRFKWPKGIDSPIWVLLEVPYPSSNGGNWYGPDDHSSEVRISHDAGNLYIGLSVTDDFHENSAHSPWNGDSVQLMIANEDQNGITALYNYALGGVEDNPGEVIVQHERSPASRGNVETEAAIVRDPEADRTIYEIRLPKEALGLEALEPGTQFGLGMAINDGDEDTPGQKGWGGLGAHAIVPGKSPEETALVTLGSGTGSGDLMILSSVNISMDTFSFRVTDEGGSRLDPGTATLTINGVEAPPTAILRPMDATSYYYRNWDSSRGFGFTEKKQVDATDFSYRREEGFPPGTSVDYVIKVSDANEVQVKRRGTMTARDIGVLLPSMMALDVDPSKEGFIWRIWQSDIEPIETIAEAETALAGRLVFDIEGEPWDNEASRLAIGPALDKGVFEDSVDSLIRFEIPSVINLNIAPGGIGTGNFASDDSMPGLPGDFGTTDGAAVEIRSFIGFPEGIVTLGVNSDDGFRAGIGHIDDPGEVIVAGEFNGPRGASDTTFKVDVREAGIYPVRIVYYNAEGGAGIEFYSVKEDGSKVLINDRQNGGLPAWRSGKAPEAPPGFLIRIGRTGQGEVELSWDMAGPTLQQSPDMENWSDVPGAVSPHRPENGPTHAFYRLRR